MSAIGFIPVRGGSKSIPLKNIRLLAGKPLVLWMVEAAVGSGVLDQIIVSTDDTRIRTVVEAAGLPTVSVVDRDPANATDTASTESVMLEYAARERFEDMVLLQATSPLTTSEDIAGAMKLYRESHADSLVTGVRQKRFIWSIADSGFGAALNYDPFHRPRRQEFAGYVVENGAIVICSRAGLLEHSNRLFGNIAVYEMAEETYLEIDEPSDWKIIESLLIDRSQGSEGHDLRSRAKKVRMVLTDVDGVLTDAGMYYGESGEELKKFNTRDGKGLELARAAGLKTGIVTSENTQLVERRAQKLKLDFLYQGVQRKWEVVSGLCNELGLSPENVAYIGDDVNDLEVLTHVGFAACPADAVAAVQRAAHYRAEAKGGEGVIREVCDLILKLKATE